jgi:hypothetical protein
VLVRLSGCLSSLKGQRHLPPSADAAMLLVLRSVLPFWPPIQKLAMLAFLGVLKLPHQ